MDILLAGWQALLDYFTVPRTITLVIVFFLSGAISEFMSQGAVLKYFGPNAKKSTAYTVASISGLVLTVCSCSVLPMFASIWKKGAGIGPAVTFLFSGPAINLLAITFTFSYIGTDIGIARIIGAIVLAVVIGILMQVIFQKDESKNDNEKGESKINHEKMFQIEEKVARPLWQTLLFFITLLIMLLSGMKTPLITLLAFVILVVQLLLFFKKDELWDWCLATFDLAKIIIPLFVVGIFIAGVITVLIPEQFMTAVAGENTFLASFTAAVFGAFMYFATLTEVPIVNSFLDLGMAKSPAVALLLAGPSLSLPNMIVISRVMGLKRTGVYVFLVTLFSALVGVIAGWILF
ncbi:permease [Bacillaceae bacterium IKA-2]|nr:permease [Bacillaceae bacterium IKA-2]